MVDEIERAGFVPDDTATVLSGIVIMTFDGIDGQSVFVAKPGNELDE